MQTQTAIYTAKPRNIEQPLKMVENRLKYWGIWYRHSLADQKFPMQSAFLNKPRDAFSGPKKRDIKDNPDAEEVNIIIIQLHHRHPQWESAVREEYTEFDRPQIYRAKKVGLSRAKYLAVLGLAKAWIEARLT